jgi:integrase
VQRVRSVFKFGVDSKLIEQAVVFGPNFKKPSRKVMLLHRESVGERMLEAQELRTIINAASQPMKAMVLLGINCGFGNDDIARLTTGALDFTTGWVRLIRHKSGALRRCPLWPETIAAITDALAVRPKHKDPSHAAVVFMTTHGNPWSKTAVSELDSGEITLTNNGPVTQEFNKLLRKLDIKRPGICFYALRHTFATIGGDKCDEVACNALMGHVDSSMAARYRERIKDERLQAVSDYVRDWLYPCYQPGGKP